VVVREVDRLAVADDAPAVQPHEVLLVAPQQQTRGAERPLVRRDAGAVPGVDLAGGGHARRHVSAGRVLEHARRVHRPLRVRPEVVQLARDVDDQPPVLDAGAAVTVGVDELAPAIDRIDGGHAENAHNENRNDRRDPRGC
jgi:hypothetical protein